MRLAYLLIIHRNEKQAQRLFRSIYDPENLYVFHIDAKSKPEFHQSMHQFLAAYDNVHILESENCRWGGFSMVHVELEAIRYLIKTGQSWDFFINLSGQDFPLKTQNQIKSFLKKNSGSNFLTVFDEAYIKQWCNPYILFRPRSSSRNFNNARSRVERYFVEVPGMSQLMYVPFVKRRFIEGNTWYAGWQWMILSRAFCEYIFKDDLLDKYVSFFKNTFIPDEGFFQTVIMNSPFKETVVNDYQRTVTWQYRGDVNIFREKDYDFLLNSKNLFARKFDEAVDSKIITALEKHLLDSQLTGSQI
jgi:hypothetical protein